ncbi:hypothetical protein niasHT_022018 [Heterodera trifolii]|uniref:Phlebovirus glycoprotein G2 fusion domain-containing protein n=1 Tax=Heterodera trifolii TaxID=157864 RepID=A0ABD2JBF7_9BILA
MLAGGLSLSLLCFIFTMCSMVGYAMAGLKILFWIFSVLFARLFKPRKETWVLSEEEENLLYPHRRIRRPRPATRNWASGRVSQMTMLVMAFLPFVHGGIETVAIMAKSESCLNNGTTKMCQVKGSVTLALLPAGQPNVLSIKTDDGLILGTLQVILKGLSLECQAFTKAWKRSYEIASLASKRCPSAGSCVGDFCTKVRPSTAMPHRHRPNIGRHSMRRWSAFHEQMWSEYDGPHCRAPIPTCRNKHGMPCNVLGWENQILLGGTTPLHPTPTAVRIRSPSLRKPRRGQQLRLG